MNDSEKKIPVKMARANLNDLPVFDLPGDFSLRWYQPGDESHWLRIHLTADQFNEITPELFQRQFGLPEERGLQATSSHERQSGLKSALRELGERQCYLLLAPKGEVIGTGTAWYNDDFEGARWGRVHWMAVMPQFQGRGLGKALLAAICGRLRRLGHDRAYLTTSTARVPAIRLYRKFGFEPLIRSIKDERIWRDLIPLVK